MRDATPAPVPAEARRQEILRMLLAQDAVTTREIIERFRVSAMTAHRDLDALQAQGVLRKVHGGATARPSGLFESSLAYRVAANAEAKRLIARRAASYVAPGSSILLDDSTTCLAMVPFLVQIRELTIVTNFLAVVEELTRKGGDTRFMVIGGDYDAKYHALLGVVAERTLSELRVDYCFMSASAVDPSDGVFHQDAAEVRLMRTRVGVAERSMLLIDSSKLGNRALHRVFGFDAFERVVIDGHVEAAAVEALRRGGVLVDIAHEHDDEPADTRGDSE